ncbi:hypothetical protein [Leptothermofonsia sp. ETS-13]|uniref:hypothetical protein n=1 Tax=Leptothermofonsia sp. ETS-13 TaxID=3035696 RepID=UPI003BA0F1F2
MTPSNSGNPRKTASCQRDQGWYIRLIAYCVLAGDEKPLTDIGTLGMKEMYISPGNSSGKLGRSCALPERGGDRTLRQRGCC